jgi:hypothetical protein
MSKSIKEFFVQFVAADGRLVSVTMEFDVHRY